jgi:hypothetical protein
MTEWLEEIVQHSSKRQDREVVQVLWPSKGLQLLISVLRVLAL